MSLPARRVLLGALGAAVVAGALGPGIAPATVLRVTGEHGETVLDVAVRPGDPVALSFVHSSEHVRVVSTFRVEGDALGSPETRMEGYGPGLPATASAAGAGALVSRERTRHPRISLLVSPETGHRIVVAGRQIDLSRRVPAGRSAYRFIVELGPRGRPPRPGPGSTTDGTESSDRKDDRRGDHRPPTLDRDAWRV